MMTADDFVRELSLSAPQRQALLQAGYSEEGADDIRAMFMAMPVGIPRVPEPAVVVDLMLRYDTSRLQIGGFGFRPVIREQAAGLVEIGFVDVDPVVWNIATGEVELRSHDDYGRIELPSAVSQQSFLASLLPAAQYYGSAFVNAALVDDDAVRAAVARQCADLAGGRRYEGFVERVIFSGLSSMGRF